MLWDTTAFAWAFVFESDHHSLRYGGKDMVLEEGGEEEGSARSQVDRRSHNAAAIDIEIDRQGRRFSLRQTDFALEAVVNAARR